MKRALKWVLVIMMMTLVVLVFNVGAETTVEVALTEESRIVPSENGLSNQEAAEGYIYRMMSGVPRSSMLSSVAGDKLTGNDAVLYTLLRAKIEEVASGQLESTEFSISVNDLYKDIKSSYTAAELGFDSFATADNRTAAKQIIYQQMETDTGKVLDSLVADCAYELYWFDKTAGMEGSNLPGISFTFSGSPTDEIMINDHVTFKLAVAKEYSASGSVGTYEYNTDLYGSIVLAAANAQEIISANVGKSNLQKLEAYRDAICNLVNYNTDAASGTNVDYGNPWQLVWVFDKNPSTKVVCEGYSKAFQYLCDESRFNGNIYSILATGTMQGGTGAGPHMWNILTMEDGKRYIADITNSDTGSIGDDGSLFLKGYDEYNQETGWYTYTANNSYVFYIFDNKTKSLFSAEELAMAGEDYVASSVDPEDPITWAGVQELITDGTSPIAITMTSDVAPEKPNSAQPLIIPTGKTVTIDLNGYVIDRGRRGSGVSGGYVFHVENGATLIIRDTSTDGGGMLTGTYDESQHGCVFNEGTFTLESGSISGNRGSVENYGIFILTGGTIADDTVVCGVENYGTMTFSSGTISGCKAGIRNQAGGTVTMNGGTIRDGSIGIQNSGILTINGGLITGNTSGGIYCYEGSSTVMNGGTISDNHDLYSRAGGVRLQTSNSVGCEFTITGGEISGNTSTIGAGGISIDPHSTVNLQGGLITGNHGKTAGGIENRGLLQIVGSPVVSENYLNDNTTVNNVYQASSFGGIVVTGEIGITASIGITTQIVPQVFTLGLTEYGGGVNPFVSDDSSYTTAIMSGEAAIGTAATVSFAGNGGTGSMDSITVIRNISAKAPVCGFTAPEGKVFEGWKVGSASGTVPAGGTYTVTQDTVLTAVWNDAPETMTWIGIQEQITNGTSPMVITLTSDVTPVNPDSAQPLIIQAGKTVTIDLNGYVIDRGRRDSGVSGGSVFHIATGGTLIVKDTSTNGSGKLTGAYDANDHGCVFNEGTFILEGGSVSESRGGVDNRGTFTLAGGSITGIDSAGGVTNQGTMTLSSGSITNSYRGIVNKANGTVIINGGNISENVGDGIQNFGTLTINAGEISDNACCGIYCYDTSKTVMNGGTISGNNTSGYESAGGIYLNDSSEFTISGGEISGNTSRVAGAIYVAGEESILNLQGGRITGNTSGSEYGAIDVRGIIRMEGSPVVSGNLNSGSSGTKNVLRRIFSQESIISITGPFENGASIYISTQGVPRTLTTGWEANQGGVNPFVSDNSNYTTAIMSGEVAIGTAATVSFAGNGGTGSMDSITVIRNISAKAPTCGFTAPEGKVFEGWKVGTTDTVISAGESYTPNQDLILTAQWIDEAAVINTGWSDLRNQIINGDDVATYTLDSDIIANENDQPILIPAGKTVTVDLNGHTIDRGLADKNPVWNGYVFNIESGAKLIIQNSSEAGNGTIAGEKMHENQIGRACIINNGTLIMNGGMISGNYNGAVRNRGTFILNNGLITGNGHTVPGSETFSVEIAVFNETGSLFMMNGGSIADNTAAGIWNYGNLTLTDGEISGNGFGGLSNYTDASAEISGGVFSGNGWTNANSGAISNLGTLTMTGGTVSENIGFAAINQNGATGVMTLSNVVVSENFAKGISLTAGVLNIYGKVIVEGNRPARNSYDEDVYLGEGQVITITDTLDADAMIGVLTYPYGGKAPSGTSHVKFTSGFFDENGNPRVSATNFKSDGGYIKVMKDGELAFASTYQFAMDVPDFILPAGIRNIESEVFAGTDVSVVKIPKGTEEVTIGSGAFAGCRNLRQIYIPENVTFIAEDAFDEHLAIVIFGAYDSYAETYAENHSNCTFIRGQ